VEFVDIKSDASGNLYICGIITIGAFWDGFVLKYSSSGGVQWSNIYNGLNYDWFDGIAVDPSANYLYVSGRRNEGSGNEDYCLIRYNANTGMAMWTNVYNNGNREKGYRVAVDKYGNAYVTGYRFFGGQNVAHLRKYNPSGTLEWAQDYLVLLSHTACYGIAVDNGNYIYTVGSISIGSDYYWLILKYDSDGVNIWGKTMVCSGSSTAEDVFVQGSGDGDIYVTGKKKNLSDYDFFTIRMVQIPFAPSGLKGTGVSQNAIKLRWNDSSSSELAYKIYKSTDSSNFSLIYKSGPGETSYIDAACQVDTQYWYKVSSTNEAGESTPLNVVNVTITVGEEPEESNIVDIQDGESDVIVGRNKIYTSKNEQVYFYFQKHAKIIIYTLDGREICRINGKTGSIETWGEENTVPGVYIACIEVEGRKDMIVRKLLVLR